MTTNCMNGRNGSRENQRRNTGFLLVELAVGLSILTVGLLGFLSVFQWNFRAAETVDVREDVRLAFQSASEQLRNADFSTLYHDYHGKSLTIYGLETVDGGTATVKVNCHVNEGELPAEFGPLFDLDGSGELDKPDCSDSYKILPVQLTVNFSDHGRSESRDLFIVVLPKPSTGSEDDTSSGDPIRSTRELSADR